MEPKQPDRELKRMQAGKLLLFWLRGITELLLYAPAWLVPAVYSFEIIHGRLLWLLQLPLLTLIGIILAYPIRRTWLRWVTAIIVGAAEMTLFAPAVWWQAALFAAGGGAAVLRGMAVTSAESHSSDVPRYGIGIAIYAVCGLICSRLPEWTAYMPWLTAAGVVSLAIALFTWNNRLLQRETLSSEARAVPAAARGHNRLMIAAVLVLSIGAAAAASGAAGQMLQRMLRSLLGLLASSGNDQPVQPPTQPIQPPPQLPPPDEPGWLARALEVLFYFLGAAAVLVVMLLIARTAYRHRREIARRLSRLFARLASLLGRTHSPAADVGYRDEETSIWPWDIAETALKRIQRRRSAGDGAKVRWSELGNNCERARYLYRRWLGRLRDRGFAAPRHLTPYEVRLAAEDWEKKSATGSRRLQTSESQQADKLVELYYKARYGDGDIEGEDIERLYRQSRASRH